MLYNENTATSLNEQQVMMLRLFKKPLPQEDFMQMQQLAVKLLAKQLDEKVDEWETENGIALEKLDVKHFRSSIKN
ncbi:hypothetical protein [Parasediminibacterium sp. JCM 36343]|uniref:hypothetical protein n=1 Tax=Parasediminibacterium sp. JCM 36343 TaxID=3374279 RepID=UPI00397A7070